MKRKIRKMIVAGITACAIMVPTIASAYSQHPRWGCDFSGAEPGKCYGYASYDHHMCYIKIDNGEESAEKSAWCGGETKPIEYYGSIDIDHHFD